MLVSDFDYALPEELIAQFPLPERSASRLLRLSRTAGLSHHQFSDLVDWLQPNDLIIFNNTRVIPARLFGVKVSGGKIEALIERLIDDHRAIAHIKASKAPKVGSQLLFEQSITATVKSRQADLFELEFLNPQPVLELLQQYGHIPLPPYIERQPDQFDQERYQTIYAQHNGAVAAPTAGLHFDEQLLLKIKETKIDMGFVTLHVGAGTFQPIRSDTINDHRMHAEYVEVTPAVCEQVHAAKARGGRVIAVGTTSVRALESACQSGQIEAYAGDTRLFIYPGYSFKCIDVIITNFHLPKSSLLMLVAAFAGHKTIIDSYQEAINAKYRFFSYGDAMWIE